MTLAVDPADAVVAILALAGGYLVGSVPLARWIARAAGVDADAVRAIDTGSSAAWTTTGAGLGLLVLMGEVATGVIPVALGLVTWSWAIGWAAGLGALVGACWPALGRAPGGRGIAVLGGVLFSLAPLAGIAAIIVAAMGAVVGRIAGRAWRVAAIVAGLAAYPLLFLAIGQDVSRLAAVIGLYLVVAVRQRPGAPAHR